MVTAHAFITFVDKVYNTTRACMQSDTYNIVQLSPTPSNLQCIVCSLAQGLLRPLAGLPRGWPMLLRGMLAAPVGCGCTAGTQRCSIIPGAGWSSLRPPAMAAEVAAPIRKLWPTNCSWDRPSAEMTFLSSLIK